MSYCLEPGEPPGAAVRRVAAEQAASALDELRNDDRPVGWRVHQLRKRCKKIRAAVRLIRPGFDQYKEANRCFRDIAREVSDHRDMRVMAELADELADAHDDETGTKDAAGFFRAHCRIAEQHAAGLLPRLEKRLTEAALCVERWNVAGIGSQHAIDGMLKTLRRAHRCHAKVGEEAPVAVVHEWRKRSKYHRLHVRLLGKHLPACDQDREERFKRTDGLAGDAHDCSVLLDDLAGQPRFIREHSGFRALALAVSQRRRDLRRAALQAASGLFDAGAERFAERLGDRWAAARVAN